MTRGVTQRAANEYKHSSPFQQPFPRTAAKAAES